MKTTEELFWAKVDPCRTDGCALWLGATSGGYGRISVRGVLMYAHHFLVGKPPKGMEWDHVRERGCTHRECIWPAHLELVTPQINTHRGDGPAGVNARREVCKEGHPLAGANLVPYFRERRCRTCYLEWMRAYMRKRRSEALFADVAVAS